MLATNFYLFYWEYNLFGERSIFRELSIPDEVLDYVGRCFTK